MWGSPPGNLTNVMPMRDLSKYYTNRHVHVQGKVPETSAPTVNCWQLRNAESRRKSFPGNSLGYIQYQTDNPDHLYRNIIQSENDVLRISECA